MLNDGCFWITNCSNDHRRGLELSAVVILWLQICSLWNWKLDERKYVFHRTTRVCYDSMCVGNGRNLEWVKFWMNVYLDIACHGLSRIPGPIGPWEMGKTITHWSRIKRKWQSFSWESMYECLWRTDPCVQRLAKAASSSWLFITEDCSPTETSPTQTS